jgi:uncharacterized membrane protein
MIREELLHPMLAHFPLAMFALALFTKSFELILFKKFNDLSSKLSIISKFLIFSAPAFFLITIYLGDVATDIIKNNFCDLALISKHEDLSYYALYFFIGTLAFEALSEINKKFKMPLQVLVLLTLIFGNYFLFKAAHLGGELVYEKGAAVKVAPKCN